jgi:hypothetical protein
VCEHTWKKTFGYAFASANGFGVLQDMACVKLDKHAYMPQYYENMQNVDHATELLTYCVSRSIAIDQKPEKMK